MTRPTTIAARRGAAGGESRLRRVAVATVISLGVAAAVTTPVALRMGETRTTTLLQQTPLQRQPVQVAGVHLWRDGERNCGGSAPVPM